MPVFIKTLGNGPDMVLLHGWSMHSGIWQPMLQTLQQQFRLHLVDLPGHGQSDWQTGDLHLDTLVDRLAERLDFPAVWLGWSLGGLIALRLAQRYPQRVRRLILLAATPQFVQTADWSCAMPAEVFQSFADRLQQDAPATLQQFLLLQAKGAAHARQQIRQMAQDLAVQQAPDSGALKEGLQVLLTENMRPALQQLHCPVQLISGSRDSLIPVSVQAGVSQLQVNARLDLIEGAGHAPFVSHPAECLQLIEQFCDD